MNKDRTLFLQGQKDEKLIGVFKTRTWVYRERQENVGLYM
jgi:hypothetical protein